MHRLTNIDKENKIADCEECGSFIEIVIYTNRPRCKESSRISHNNQIARHGLTRLVTKKVLADAFCYICGSTESLAIDHDHVTGKLRGVLCQKHNLALGLFKDNISYLLSAAQYLLNPPGISLGNT